MKIRQYGNPDGKKVIYFHGVPGGPEEAAIFEDCAKKNHLNIICPDRFAIDSALQGKEYYQSLAQSIDEIVKNEEMAIIGFSIGTHVAIETSPYLMNHIGNMHLISSAAPISGGDFINDMAGGSVFKAAIRSPSTFKLMVGFQRLLAKLSPRLLTNMLFASSMGQDQTLSKQSTFLTYITPVLQKCFLEGSRGYLRDLFAYVTPWESALQQCSAPITLWHGTQDNWSPFTMASYLDKQLDGSLGVNPMAGLSHYSCLQQAAPKICAQLNTAQTGEQQQVL